MIYLVDLEFVASVAKTHGNAFVDTDGNVFVIEGSLDVAIFWEGEGRWRR